MRWMAFVVALPLLGCASGKQDDMQFQLEKSQAERDRMRLAYEEESAKSLAIADEYTKASAKWDVQRAELSALRQRVADLDKTNRDLNALLDKRAAEPMTRPAIPATPLPGSLDARLSEFASKYDGRVIYDRGRAAISFANDRLFDPGSDVVKRDAIDAFNELATIARREDAQSLDVIVVGHTDDAAINSDATLAKHPSNWHLSVHRAIAVKTVLVGGGIDERRVGVMGYGPTRPAGSDRATNRRVEVYFVLKSDVRSFEPVRR